jgi:hypothetical protein
VARATSFLLFVSGIFFGGAIDHFVLLLMGSGRTPYGLDVGVGGNAALAALDLAISAACCCAYRWLESRRA